MPVEIDIGDLAAMAMEIDIAAMAMEVDIGHLAAIVVEIRLLGAMAMENRHWGLRGHGGGNQH